MSDLQSLSALRGDYRRQLTLFEKYVTNLDTENLTEKELKNLEQRLKKVVHLLESFSEVQLKIDIINNKIDEESSTELEEFQNRYFNITSEVEIILESNIAKNKSVLLKSSRSSESGSVCSDPGIQESQKSCNGGASFEQDIQRAQKSFIRLPTINLPSFEGSFTLWREFYDTFKSLIVSNSQLTNVQKLTYLRAALKGEPAGLIRSLETTDGNFEIAWTVLQKRYDNKRRIVNNHVQSILNLPQINRDSPIALRNFINNLQNHIQCLEALGQEVESWNALLIPIITKKLDYSIVKDWEEKLNSNIDGLNNIPTLFEFLEFINRRLNTLEMISTRKGFDQVKESHSKTNSFASVNIVCTHCKRDHLIYNCDEFLKFDSNTRANRVKELKLCFNCLRQGHMLQNCHSKSSCKKCNRRHHTILHFDSNTAQQRATNNSSSSNVEAKQGAVNSSVQQSTSTDVDVVNCTASGSQCVTQVLLSTAKVYVCDTQSTQYSEARVLLDSASQSNFITEQMCEKLQLKKFPIKMNITGINQGISKISYKVEINIKSRYSSFTTNLVCLVIPTITQPLPLCAIDPHIINIPANLTLADPTFYEPQSIDILLGSEVFWSLLCVGQIQQKNSPVLQKTKLGWILGGNICSKNADTKQVLNSTTLCSLNDLNQNLEKFWQSDEFVIPDKGSLLTQEEKYCENYYQDTTYRDEEGKFVVRIPFNSKLDQLGDSYEIAKSRLENLEKKLQGNQSLKKAYHEVIAEYIELGHITKITPDNKTSFYLPHHAVLKDSETTSVRVVFDGSCNLENGLNINQTQCVGPTIQNTLFSILVNFRVYTYVFTADIEKMYRQVWVNQSDRQYQRILWRFEQDQEISHYELKTVTFGLSASPYLAVRSLFQLATENETVYPVESQILKKSTFVDDILVGRNNIEELEIIKSNLESILKTAGFNLRKFKSNTSSKSLNKDMTSKDSFSIEKRVNKALGIHWDTKTDEFFYSFEFNFQHHVTKRTILATVAQIYDPLGFLAPVTFFAKVLMQDLWKINLGWDESVPLEIATRWLKFRDKLSHVSKLKIPRQVTISFATYFELHTFSDASVKGYGICIYVKSIDHKGECLVRLLAAKSRVAPIKPTTIPRLELCGAVLAAQLAAKFKSILDIQFDKQFFWCDSQIALAWIKGSPGKWKTYVANRVSEILSLSDPNEWNYIRTEDNVADIVSRGMQPNEIINATCWWHGPQWLSQPQSEWPIYDNKPIVDIPECKSETKTFITVQLNTFPIEQFSSLTKAKRVTAWCLRFLHNSAKQKITGSLSVKEINDALISLVKIVQNNCFSREIHDLKKGHLNSKSSMLSLSPFLDSHGILRVGGRLELSKFSYNKKHPILLPKHHHFTTLVMRHYHLKLLHAGPKLLLSSVREMFWPLDGKNIARNTVRKCVRCFRFNPKSNLPIMGNLPAHRTVPNYPFYCTGVDYAGPFLLKDRFTRSNKTVKGYIALFVCFNTKAIHLELVSNLTTQGFLSALRRFVSRRGKPAYIYSDNGTNFVGANNEMQKMMKFLSVCSDEIQSFLSSDGIEWHFIPPSAPNFGGLWEAGVKSTKHHLKRVLTNSCLTYEDFTTVLVQIESVLNSRPLTSLSSDPNDVEALTPAHFLIGRSFTSLPETDYRHTAVNRIKQYQRLQKAMQHFWDKWSKEYIHELQQRQKWKEQGSKIQLGVVVLVKEDNLPPARWLLGRVVQLHPGTDGVTRVVTVKCGENYMKRALSKLCPLPIEMASEQNHEIECDKISK